MTSPRLAAAGCETLGLRLQLGLQLQLELLENNTVHRRGSLETPDDRVEYSTRIDERLHAKHLDLLAHPLPVHPRIHIIKTLYYLQ